MANFIYGKVKRKQNIFRIIKTEDEVYETSDLNLKGIDYNPGTLIEEEEIYQLSNFSKSDFALELIQCDLDSVNYDQIEKADLKRLSFICTVQKNFYFFQSINPSFFISKKWFSIDELSLEVNKPIITINPFADAIYDKANDRLLFRKLSVAQKIFKGMDQLYRAATDEEVLTFLANEFLEVSKEFVCEKVTIPNRKRIALVNETLSKFTPDEKQAIYDYTNQYGRVQYHDGKFKIETDDDLKFVLWGIEQRFYTTPIGGEKRIANSVITL